MPRVAIIVLAVACSACGGKLVRVVPDGAGNASSTAATDPSFAVTAHVAGIRDPLPVSGADVEYSDLATALTQAILRVVKPRHDSVLTVELIAGDARYRHSRLSASLVVRATLRSNSGNAFIAQTEAVCREGAIVDPESGARVIWTCMTHLGHDLSGWLEGLRP